MQTYARAGIFYQPGLHLLMLSSQVKSRLLLFSLSCFSWKEGIIFKTTLINILLNCMGYFEMWVGYKDLTWFQAWQWRREGRQGQRWGRKGSRSPKLSGQSRQRALPVKMLSKWWRLIDCVVLGIIDGPLKPSWTYWQGPAGWWSEDRCDWRRRLVEEGNSTRRRPQRILSNFFLALAIWIYYLRDVPVGMK